MKHECPVCAYRNMPDAPQDYEICPCCGTEFGMDDVERTHEELRKEWMAKGARWFSDESQAPRGWNAMDQLIEAELLPYEAQPSESYSVPPTLELRTAKPRFRGVSAA